MIQNDGSIPTLERLLALKCIFAAQLPKMPREYIVRLVFDRRHESLAILRNGKDVLGGICYRPFLEQEFAEIAFCAITASEQVRGFGTRVMNHLKERAKGRGIRYFLTYADNHALGYFKKQGFALDVSMPRSQYFGYIKDYDGGTLMECEIYAGIDYLRIRETLEAQKKAVEDELQRRYDAAPTYQLDGPVDPSKPLLDQIPGLRELGYTEADLQKLAAPEDPDEARRRADDTDATAMLASVKAHEAAWPFLEPVDTEEVHDYLATVKKPIDLSAIDRKHRKRSYDTFSAFRDDLTLMFDNCRAYNRTGLFVKTADALEKHVKRECVRLDRAREAAGLPRLDDDGNGGGRDA